MEFVFLISTLLLGNFFASSAKSGCMCLVSTRTDGDPVGSWWPKIKDRMPVEVSLPLLASAFRFASDSLPFLHLLFDLGDLIVAKDCPESVSGKDRQLCVPIRGLLARANDD